MVFSETNSATKRTKELRTRSKYLENGQKMH